MYLNVSFQYTFIVFKESFYIFTFNNNEKNTKFQSHSLKSRIKRKDCTKEKKLYKRDKNFYQTIINTNII